MIMLELEKDQNLLKEFGRTMAYLAFVEYALGEAILTLDKKFSHEKVQYVALGQKIKIIEKRESSLKELNPFIAKLKALNEDRKVLVHGITGGRNSLYVIHHRGENTELTIDFLQKITNDAKELMHILSSKVWTKVHKDK